MSAIVLAGGAYNRVGNRTDWSHKNAINLNRESISRLISTYGISTSTLGLYVNRERETELQYTDDCVASSYNGMNLLHCS
jgi:molybdopterin-guanine dinucleotide biosynthesis protein A